jgi:hypothetical protein
MTMSKPALLCAVVVAALLLPVAPISPPAPARAAAPSPCLDAPTPLWQGRSKHLPVTVTASGRSYRGTVLRGAGLRGRRPGVVLMHGVCLAAERKCGGLVSGSTLRRSYLYVASPSRPGTRRWGGLSGWMW